MLTHTHTHQGTEWVRSKTEITTFVWVIVIVAVSFGSCARHACSAACTITHIGFWLSTCRHRTHRLRFMSAFRVFVDRGMVQDMVFEAFVLFCALTSKLIVRWCFSSKWILNRCCCCFYRLSSRSLSFLSFWYGFLCVFFSIETLEKSKSVQYTWNLSINSDTSAAVIVFNLKQKP